MTWLSLAGLTFAALFPLVNPFAALPLFASLTQDGPAQWRKEMAIKASFFVFVILIVTEYIGNGLLNFFGLSLGMLQIAGGLIVANTAWQMSTGAPRISQKEEHRVKHRVFQAVKDSTVHAVSAAKSSVVQATHDATDAVVALPSHLLPGEDVESDDEVNRSGPPVPSTESSAAAHGQAGAATTSTDETTGAGSPQTAASDDQRDATGEAKPANTVKSKKTFPDISFSPMAMPMLAGPGSMGVVIGIVAQNKGVADSIGIAIGIALIALLSLVTLLAASPINSSLGASGVMVLQRVFGFITLGIAVALIATGISSLFGIPIVG